MTLLEPTATTMVDDDLSQGGAAAPDAKVARRKMTGLSNKVRPYHHGHPPWPHRHLHCPRCLLHGYNIRYSKSWLWTFMTRWIGGKQMPSGTRLRYLKNSYRCHQLQQFAPIIHFEMLLGAKSKHGSCAIFTGQSRLQCHQEPSKFKKISHFRRVLVMISVQEGNNTHF